jgi:hypothetical protein
MGTELPTKIMLGQTLVLMQMTFLNDVRKVGRLVLSRTSCCYVLSLIMKRKTNASNSSQWLLQDYLSGEITLIPRPVVRVPLWNR